MATLTKTYTDNHYDSSTYKKTWTVTYNFNDITVSNSTFTFVTPTIQAKFTGTKGLYRSTAIEMSWLQIDGYNYIPSGYGMYDDWFWSNPINQDNNFISGSSDTIFTMTKREKDRWESHLGCPHSFTISTSDIFNSRNKTLKNINVTAYFDQFLATNTSKSGTGSSSYYEGDGNVRSTLGTITLNAPPTATYTVDTSRPYYSGAGGFIGSNYDVSVSYEAQYGGDVTSVKLQVGDNVDEFNPNNASGQCSLSIYTTQTGSFTPTLTITDTRGQIRVINLPSITVQPYESPTLDYNTQRVNNQGQPADEGTYARINTNLTYLNVENNHILEPTIVIKDGDTTLTTTKTWYTANGNLISNWSTITTPATVYAIVSKSNGFISDKSYNVSVTLTDTNNVSSQTISQVLPTAFYMLDFRAGGRGMAIGKIADKNGLEIQFPTMIGEGLSTPLTNGEIDISKYQLVVGKYNKIDDDALFIVGAGTDNNRFNSVSITKDGVMNLYAPDANYATGINFINYDNDLIGYLFGTINGSTKDIVIQVEDTTTNVYDMLGIEIGKLDGISLRAEQWSDSMHLHDLSKSILQIKESGTIDLTSTGALTISSSNATLTSSGALTVGGKVQDGSGNILANKLNKSDYAFAITEESISVGKIPYSDSGTTTYYRSSSVSISKDGYHPIGIVGWNITGDNSSHIMIYRFDLDDRAYNTSTNKGTATLNYGLRNRNSNATTSSYVWPGNMVVDILWRKHF